MFLPKTTTQFFFHPQRDSFNSPQRGDHRTQQVAYKSDEIDVS